MESSVDGGVAVVCRSRCLCSARRRRGMRYGERGTEGSGAAVARGVNRMVTSASVYHMVYASITASTSRLRRPRLRMLPHAAALPRRRGQRHAAATPPGNGQQCRHLRNTAKRCASCAPRRYTSMCAYARSRMRAGLTSACAAPAGKTPAGLFTSHRRPTNRPARSHPSSPNAGTRLGRCGMYLVRCATVQRPP